MDSEIPYAGRAFLYVLCMDGPEDLLKVGISKNPLTRWCSFHPRWFEVFDLEHSFLIEAESRRDAQSLEAELHRALDAHRCPMPMTMRGWAGGGTEWYRGAYPTVRRLGKELSSQGYVVRDTARPWLTAALRAQQEMLISMIYQAHTDQRAGWLTPTQKQALQDLLDAHRALNPDVFKSWPSGLLDDLALPVIAVKHG